jgi:DNA polymerase elongation subunit (family B)
MERFYKSNLIHIPDNFYKNDIEMQIIEGWAQDEEDDNEEDEIESQENDLNNEVYTIRCFGVTNTGISVTCKITGFKPFYYIKVPNTFTKVHLAYFLKFIESSYFLKSFKSPLAKENGRHRSCLEEKKDLFGFRNGKEYRFVKLVFNNYSALMKSRYLFKKAIEIANVTKRPTKFKLYESNFEPFMRYCHIKEILMAGWIRLPKGKYSVTRDSATTQIEVSIDRKLVISMKDYQDIANFLQASWDIEVYSHDRTFPDPKYKITKSGNTIYPNEIFQIATTYKYVKNIENTENVENTGNKDEFLVKHLLTLKRCEKIDDPNVIVEECENERDLIRRWVNTISKMDPDIFYTYNGDSFDCMYLVERAELLGLVSSKKSGSKTVKQGFLLKGLSRMTCRQAEIKKEYFSSSAYGDSEFNRVYIPGRLNYDLLIHYKRGMKKYASYKLDNIASEILKQNKHDVSAKDIFDLYQRGNPDDIRKIGLYCIQDTALLQRLVDKQLILTNIMQLANVTYVPIGFLTTRGQTIKVYSQLLRKARQMNFLVPHTNFNEDSYPLQIKCKEQIPFEENDIGEYIEINCGKSQTDSYKQLILTAKISEIVDDTTFIALCDTEIKNDFFNIKFTYKRKDYTISRLWSNDDAIDDSFTGATVLEPIPGMYKDNIAVLDFASLYPTIMISRNLCYSAFVLDKQYLDIPGVNYEKIAWDDKVEYKLRQTCEGVGKSGKSKGQVCGKQAYFEITNELGITNYYCRIHDPLKKTRDSDEKYQKRDVSYNYTIVQPHTDSEGNVVNKGVLPALLEELYSERKRVKRQMAKAAEEGNKLLEDILNSTQLAIKVSLNSTYGFLGRGQGNLILKELGSIVTAVGRMLIEQSKEYAEGPFLEYIKDNNLLQHKLERKEYDLTEQEKKLVLKSFMIK